MATLGNCPFAGRSFVPFSSSNRQQNRNGHKSNRTVTRTVSARRRASFDKSAPFGSVQRGPNEWRHGPTSMLNAPRRLVDTVVKILREWSGSIRFSPRSLFSFFLLLLSSSLFVALWKVRGAVPTALTAEAIFVWKSRICDGS